MKYHCMGFLRLNPMLFSLFFLCSYAAISGASLNTSDEPEIRMITVEPGQTVSDFLYDNLESQTKFDIDPGESPEGDYLGWITFTRDGERILLTNRVTRNVTIFNWSTMDVLANIDIGGYPAGIAVSDSNAVVACASSDEVYIIDLNNLSMDTVFTLPAGQQPWIVRISPDGNTAFVSCDISNTCEVFDLGTMNHTLTMNSFPISLTSWGISPENGRNSFFFSNFEVTSDGNHLIVGDWGNNRLLFFNTTTGMAEDTIAGIPSCPIVGISGDGSKAVAVSLTNPAVLHQIDLSSHSVTGSVTLSGYTIAGMAYELGVNADGSKAFVGISGNSSAIVRFATSDFKVFTSTSAAAWIGTSPDHSLVISGQYRFSLIDFETETVLGQHIGNSQYRGEVSPVGSRAVGFTPYSHEGIYFYDYTTPNAPNYRGTTNSGLDPEGDAPHRVAITPDGAKAIVTNVLSDNATIIDLTTYAIDTIIPMGDRVQNIAVTSDSRWSVACGYFSNSVKIMDIDSNIVVADVPTNTGSHGVSISYDNNYAYIGNISAKTVSVVKLEGSTSHEIADIPCGGISLVWSGYGVSSDVEVSPTGNYVLVAASLDDQVKVIDTQTNTIVASLPVGNFPIQVAFNDSGNYAIVTNYFDDTFTVLHIDGASSSVVGSFAYGDGPLRLAYNPVLDEMGIGYYQEKKVVNVDPETGAFINTHDYSAYDKLIQLIFDEDGAPIVLTKGGYIHRSNEAIALPADPAYFDYCPAVQKAVVVMPASDLVSIIEWDTLGVKEIVTIPFSPHLILYSPSPNPFTTTTTIHLSGIAPGAEGTELKIFDVGGREVKHFSLFTFTFSLTTTVVWDGRDNNGKLLPSGIYYCRLSQGNSTQTRKILFVK